MIKLQIPYEWLSIVIDPSTFAPTIKRVIPPASSGLSGNQLPTHVYLIDSKVQWISTDGGMINVSIEAVQDAKARVLHSNHEDNINIGDAGFYFVFDNDTEAVRFKLAYF